MYLFPMITAGTFRFIYNLYARAYRHYRRIFAAREALWSFFYFSFTCPRVASPSMLVKSNADAVGERQLPTLGWINKSKYH